MKRLHRHDGMKINPSRERHMNVFKPSRDINRLIHKGVTQMVHYEYQIRKIARRGLEIVWRKILDIFVTERRAFMKLDVIQAQIQRLFIERVGNLAVISSPGCAAVLRLIELHA